MFSAVMMVKVIITPFTLITLRRLVRRTRQ